MVKCRDCRLVDRDGVRTKSGRWVGVQICINARGHGVEEVVDPNTERECRFFDKLEV